MHHFFFSFTNFNEIKVFNFQYHKGILKLELKFRAIWLKSDWIYGFELVKLFLFFVESAAENEFLHMY